MEKDDDLPATVQDWLDLGELAVSVMRAHTHIHTHTHAHPATHIHGHTYMNNTLADRQTDRQTDTHTHTHTHTHTQKRHKRTTPCVDSEPEQNFLLSSGPRGVRRVPKPDAEGDLRDPGDGRRQVGARTHALGLTRTHTDLHLRFSAKCSADVTRTRST